MWLRSITQVIAHGVGDVEQGGTFFYFMWECKLVHPLWKSIWCFLEKPGIDLHQDLAIPYLGIYTQRTLHPTTKTLTQLCSLQIYE